MTRYLFRQLQSLLALFAVLLLSSPVALMAAVSDTEAEKAKPSEVSDSNSSEIHWMTDIAAAQKKANDEDKDLLLFFTGSDWCGFCIRLHDEVLSKPEFVAMLNKKYVPVELDFPNSKKLPEALKKQNEELQGKFEVKGFPRVCVTDPDLRLYGSINGYGGAEIFHESFSQINTLADSVYATLGVHNWNKVDDPELLADAVSQIPEESIAYGWIPTVEKIVSLSKDKNPELYANWSLRLNDLQNKEYIAEAKSKLLQMASVKPDCDAMLAYLDPKIEESNGRPRRLQALYTIKLEILEAYGRFSPSLSVAEFCLNQDWASKEDQLEFKAFKARALLSLGRIDEGQTLIVERVNEQEKSGIEHDDLKLIMGRELMMAQQFSLSLDALSDYIKVVEPGSEEDKQALLMMIRIYDAVGNSMTEHGDNLMRWSKLEAESGDFDTANYLASRAANLYRAADENEKTADALAFVKANEAAKADKEEGVEFGKPVQPVLKVISAAVEAAQSSQGDALMHLAKYPQGLGKASYLIQAALAYQKIGETEKAEKAASSALEAMKSVDEQSVVDQKNLAKVQEWFVTWKKVSPSEG